MKEQFILYGICLAISFAAVAVTSFVKMIVSGIAKKCGHDLSGNAKEYIFAPMAIMIAGAGVFVWLDRFVKMNFDEKFILIVVCFSVGTMLLYLLLFQPTRKFAMKIIRTLARHFKVPDMVETVKDVLSEAETLLNMPEGNLQSTAQQGDYVLLTVGGKPPDKEQTNAEENLRSKSTDTEADKLRAMVELIKGN